MVEWIEIDHHAELEVVLVARYYAVEGMLIRDIPEQDFFRNIPAIPE
jgi:hypothetical protein